jgi:hypothetical protein
MGWVSDSTVSHSVGHRAANIPPVLNTSLTRVSESQNEQLARLQRGLLEDLPESIPYHDLKSTCYTSSVADDETKEYGDETSATHRRLEVTFGSWTEVL